MRSLLSIAILWSTLGLFAQSQGESPAPQQGILDLRSSEITSKSIFSLNGEWIFFWEHFLEPGDRTRMKEEGIPVRVPSYWESYEVEGQALTGQGFGTYALTILLPEDYQGAFCMDIPVFDVAFRCYLNDRLVHSSGKVGRSAAEEAPWYEENRFCYIPDTDTLEILIQVSNFHHRRGGFWKPLLVGGSEGVMKHAEHQKIYGYSTIGVLFFFTIFFLIFYYFARENRVMLFFALATLGMLIRSVNSGLYLSNYFVDTPWAWQIRMEYMGTYLAHLFGMLVLHTLFPRTYMTHVIRANTLLSLLLILFVMLFPPRIFTYGMMVFQPLILLFILHYLLVSFLGLLKRNLMDGVFFVSLGIFIYALINDILLANSAGGVSSTYISQLTFQIFILAMAVFIIVKWVEQTQKVRLMEEALRFRNKVLAVIAHDLKNPVASIAQFADLMATKPEISGKKEVLEALQESSGAAVSLLDNLLYWGRSQADEFKVNPETIELMPLIKEVESLFSHMASQKQVNLQLEVLADTRVYADRALINIVIRNLLSNAIKFTPMRGTVSLKTRREGALVRISVKDTGKGMQADALEAFRNMGKVESTRGTNREEGTGLGLQLAKDLVQLHGGSLTIESEAGKGSTFSFTLPAQKNE